MLADNARAFRRGDIRCPECDHQMYYAMIGTREDLLAASTHCNRCRIPLDMRRLELFESRAEVVELGEHISYTWGTTRRYPKQKEPDYDDEWI